MGFRLRLQDLGSGYRDCQEAVKIPIKDFRYGFSMA